MYLLTTFKRKKGSKNKKRRKDKGLKRTTNNTQQNYIKARTFRSVTAPILETAKEIRHWTALGHTMSQSKRGSSRGNSGSGVRNARNTVGLMKDVGFNISVTKFNRKDKGKKRGKYTSRLNSGVSKKIGQVATGAALLGGGLLATRSLINKGYLPKLLGKSSDPLVRKSRDALKVAMHNGGIKATAAIIPVGAIGATTVGADYLIDRKNDMPITRKVRKLVKG